MTYYVVIDTNVLVSALLASRDDSPTVQIISKMIQGYIVPVYSDEIMDEYREVLSRKKFKFPVDAIRYLLAAIEKYGLNVSPTAIDIILPDMKDLPFYEVVMEKRMDDAYLVTGNKKHFPIEPFILTPREFLDIMK